MSDMSVWVRLDAGAGTDTIKYLTELLLNDQKLLVSDLRLYVNGELAEWWPLNHVVEDK